MTNKVGQEVERQREREREREGEGEKPSDRTKTRMESMESMHKDSVTQVS